MIQISKTVLARYYKKLEADGIGVGYHSEYVKWLRYYLDFCAKYLVTV